MFNGGVSWRLRLRSKSCLLTMMKQRRGLGSTLCVIGDVVISSINEDEPTLGGYIMLEKQEDRMKVKGDVVHIKVVSQGTGQPSLKHCFFFVNLSIFVYNIISPIKIEVP